MLFFYTLLASIFALAQGCATDEDCSLNGVCSEDQTCLCDAGWRADDCGELDLFPAARWNGYNHTNATGPDYYKEGAGNSSWCGHIVQDPEDKTLFHLIISQMIHGCGLSGWRPFSTVVRAESRTGPAGPYNFAQSLFSTFHHNPTVIYSPADEKYLLYCIGKDVEAPTTCSSQKWSSNISVSSSSDLRDWTALSPLLENQTNPAPWPLWSAENQTQEILLAIEDENIYTAANYSGPYTKAVSTSTDDEFEDPFLWRDKRGHWHFLAHYLIDIPLGLKGPRVGAHSFARTWEGPWTVRNTTLAYNTTVDFTDGSTIVYYRRERPKLYFSDDGEMTPLYLVNGVQEFNKTGSYTLIQPIGEGAREYEKSLGF